MKKGFSLVELLIVVAFVLVFGMAISAAVIRNSKPISSFNEYETKVQQGLVLPEPTGYVVDLSGVLKEETKQKIESDLKALDQTAQVAVVTVKTTQPLSVEQYAIKLADKWKPGYKGKDNGIIFLIVTEDRKVRIEVGRGLEEVINDAKAGRILDESVVPFLRNNDWNGGALSGVEAISKEVKK
jgi:uncharacterized protein